MKYKGKEYVEVKEGLVEKGDVVFSKHPMNNGHMHEIYRTTKTLAISNNVSGGDQRFKRVISYDMNHPYVQWSRVEHTVYRPVNDDNG